MHTRPSGSARLSRPRPRRPGRRGVRRRGHEQARAGVPSRVATKLKGVERSLAQDYVDDGESAKAVTARSPRRPTATCAPALKAVKRRVVAGNETGDSSATPSRRCPTTSSTSRRRASTGRTATSSALASSLDVAADSRDELVAAIALSDADTAAYAGVLAQIAADAQAEAEDIAEALSDDTLTDAAKAALNAAATQVAATRTAALALAPAGTSMRAPAPRRTRRATAAAIAVTAVHVRARKPA